jgi:HD superfamily phosphohydrolase YqeK
VSQVASFVPGPVVPTPAGPSLHPLVAAAARGVLPGWAQAREGRRGHMERVRVLMLAWAEALGLDPVARARWGGLGLLHDALRDAPASELRASLAGSAWAEMAELPDLLLHGPAAAARLQDEGVEDRAFLLAVAWHTLGHPALDGAGRALLGADVLEPGRRGEEAWRRELRDRWPLDPTGTLRRVMVARIGWTVKGGHPLHPATVELWNLLVAAEGGVA